jgi:uncharacterized protein with GYD domain
MARCLFQASYTSEAWAVQVSNPQNRVDAIRSVMERLGGRLESAYPSFGDYDGVVIAEMPDAIGAAAFSLTTSAGGALKAIKTTPRLTIEEGMEAMNKAAGARYRPPGRS